MNEDWEKFSDLPKCWRGQPIRPNSLKYAKRGGRKQKKKEEKQAKKDDPPFGPSWP